MKLIVLNPVLALLGLSLLLPSCSDGGKGTSSDTTTLSGRITISGAFALYPMAVLWADEFKKEHPGVQIDISAGGAGKGMSDVLGGMVDLAMLSRDVKPEEVSNGAYTIAVTKDAVIPVYNATNPDAARLDKKGFSKDIFAKIYLDGLPPTWGELAGSPSKQKINAYTRSDACGAGAMWGIFLGKEQEDLRGTGVYGDPGMADAVKKDINGVGFNNVIYVYDMKTRAPYPGLRVAKLDGNANGVIDPNEDFYASLDSLTQAIIDGRYPSPPARDLFFVSKGKPSNKITTEFLRYILTKGQKLVHQAGYVPLSDSTIHEEAEKL